MLRHKRQAALPPETVRAIEGLVLDHPVGPENFIDLAYPLETRAAGGNGEDVVALARFRDQRPRRDQPGDIVHLAPIQNPGHVVVDAVRHAHDAVAERVQVPADHRGPNARFERRYKSRARAAARYAHT